MILAVNLLLAAIALVVVVIVVRKLLRRDPDGVDQFRRQIDALSPEARRPVVDRVHELDHRDDDTDTGDEPGPRR